MNVLKILCTGVALATATTLSATPAKVEALKKEFAGVRALELPGRAASTVAAASSADRAVLAEDVIRAALDVNPSAGPLLVGAIARSTPDVAAGSAVAAASLQSKQLSPITKSAVGGAPAQAEAIVNALTKARPASFATIGVAAVEVAPKSAEAILNGITAANPTLKALIAGIDSKGAKTARSVVTVLKRAEALVAKLSISSKTTPEALLAGELTPTMTAQLPSLTASVLAAPPVVGPPYTPGSPSPGEVGTGSNYEAPPTGRDYSSP
jgi:hypothetical protein